MRELSDLVGPEAALAKQMRSAIIDAILIDKVPFEFVKTEPWDSCLRQLANVRERLDKGSLCPGVRPAERWVQLTLI